MIGMRVLYKSAKMHLQVMKGRYGGFGTPSDHPVSRRCLIACFGHPAPGESCVAFRVECRKDGNVRTKTIAAEACEDMIGVVLWSVLPIFRTFGWKWPPSSVGCNRSNPNGYLVTAEQGMRWLLLGIFASGPQCGCSFRDLKICTMCERDGATRLGRWVVLHCDVDAGGIGMII